MRALAVVLLILLAASPAHGWIAQKPAPTYTGPGDIIAFTFWHGLRAYSAAVAASGTAKMMRIRNPTSGELCDVLVASNGGLGNTANCTGSGAGQSVSSFCGGADCRIATMYDQVAANACTSASCDLVQATSANQPTLSAADSYQVAVNPGATAVVLTSANNYTPSSQLSMTIAAVGNKTGTFNQNIYSAQGAQNLINGVSSGANTWQLIGTTGPTISATDGAWHTAAALLRGSGNAGICLSTSCGTFASTCLVSNTGGKPQILGVASASAVDKWREGGASSNHVLTPSEANAINANASSYWGFTPP